MKPLSENLLVLAATAEDIMRRPVHQLPNGLPADFGALAEAIRRAHAQPSEGPRATGAGVIMTEAIEGFFRGQAGNDRYQMIIGTTLPLLKNEAFQARLNERSASQETRR
ncbi:hypothetical protein JQ594_15360 [Bradyrhizobium manausense]|uniref:hypothetical protein n=1 Tax=Bradyrhizobium manausense TaxID=989370 RepID=UPI001BAD60D4|nr:hypothetical protein [Bradyrhizobium manausense]MBR0687308.1 hypothetical protein [Bradyrhizobium manausense]